MDNDGEKIRIALIVVNDVVKGLKIGEQSFGFPEGVEFLEFTIDELLQRQPNEVLWFSDKLNNVNNISVTIKRQLLTCLIDIGENCSFSKIVVADTLNISREMNRDIMRIAFQCGVIGPRAHQFKIKSGVIAQLRKQLDILNREEGIKEESNKLKTVKEIMEEAKQNIEELNAEKQSTENGKVVQKIEPTQTPTRRIISPKKKPALLLAPVPGKNPLKRA